MKTKENTPSNDIRLMVYFRLAFYFQFASSLEPTFRNAAGFRA